jgi:hypothetical protein
MKHDSVQLFSFSSGSGVKDRSIEDENARRRLPHQTHQSIYQEHNTTHMMESCIFANKQDLPAGITSSAHTITIDREPAATMMMIAWCASCRTAKRVKSIFGTRACATCCTEVDGVVGSGGCCGADAAATSDGDDEDAGIELDTGKRDGVCDYGYGDDGDEDDFEEEEDGPDERAALILSPRTLPPTSSAASRDLCAAVASAVDWLGLPQARTLVRDVVSMIRSDPIVAAARSAGVSALSREIAAACLMTCVRRRLPKAAHALQTRATAKVNFNLLTRARDTRPRGFLQVPR